MQFLGTATCYIYPAPLMHPHCSPVILLFVESQLTFSFIESRSNVQVPSKWDFNFLNSFSREDIARHEPAVQVLTNTFYKLYF
jgi:hypothetical protein